MKLDYKTAKKLLRVNFETGKLFWKKRDPKYFKDGRQSADVNCKRWNTRYAGKEALATTDGDGYRFGSVFKKLYKSHRVIWLLKHKNWPEQIDHINGVRSDNRICNLRSIPACENQKNMKRASNNTSGVTGVYFNRECGCWCACIKVNKKVIYLGSFKYKTDAIKSRKLAEKKHGFHENHGRIVSNEN